MEENKHNAQIQIRYIIVPDFILKDSSITDGEKLLFGDIASCSLKKGFCWFTNKYVANRYHISERTASRWVNDLKKKEYIIIEMDLNPNSKEIAERRIKVNTSISVLAEYMEWYGNRCPRGVVKNGTPPIDTNGAENIKDLNNTCLINLKGISNVLLNADEHQSLVKDFGESNVEENIATYSKWKLKMNAHPKSDFDSLKKWLKNTKFRTTTSYQTSVQKTGVDEVTDEDLTNLPF